jgi:hypothetical protein
MILSVREVIGLAEQCFVAAGIDEGTARTNATAIWWAEAYRGTGLATLHDLLGPLDELVATTPELERRDTPISVLDGSGHPCLLSAVPALDLSCAHADRYGTGVTYVTESDIAVDGDALGALTHRAAKRGYVSVVLTVDDAGESRTVLGTPRQPRPALAETTLNAPSKGYEAVDHAVRAERQQSNEMPLFRACFDGDSDTEPFGTVDAQLLHRLARRSTEPVPDAEVRSGFVVACVDPHHPRYSADVMRVVDRTIRDDEGRFERRFRPEATQEQVTRLIHEGVEVERELWRDIFEFSNGVLAPPFEGSEKGAGFDLNELDE